MSNGRWFIVTCVQRAFFRLEKVEEKESVVVAVVVVVVVVVVVIKAA